MAHVSSYDWPTFNQAQTDGMVLVGHLTGDEVERNCLIKCAQTVLSFGLGTAFPHDHPPIFAGADVKKAKVPTTKAAQAKALQKAFDAGPPPAMGADASAAAMKAAAFPWLMVAQIAWQIIQQLLRK